MPRASKPINAVKGHRTKAEIELRKAAEDNLKTGKGLTARAEIKKNKEAYKEFKRVKNLLKTIDKDDDLYSSIINRYCLIQSECLSFERKIQNLEEKFDKIERDYDDKKIEAEQYYYLLESLQKSILNYDRQIMTKRKMLFDIEKENVMTVAAGLRSIPKTPTQEEINPLLKLIEEDFNDD